MHAAAGLAGCIVVPLTIALPEWLKTLDTSLLVQALTSQDGEALGHNILDFSDNQTCPVGYSPPCPQLLPCAAAEPMLGATACSTLYAQCAGAGRTLMQLAVKQYMQLHKLFVDCSMRAAYARGWCTQDPDAFIRSMSTLFDDLDLESISERTSEIIAEMMEMIRQHQVNLKGVVSTVVVTTLVLEGWSTKLNPDIKIMDALKDILPMSFNERIARTVDKLMLSDLMLA